MACVLAASRLTYGAMATKVTGRDTVAPSSAAAAAGAGAGTRPKVALSAMKAALAAAGVPTAGLLERAEFEALYWRLQEEGEGGGAGMKGRGSPSLLPSPESRAHDSAASTAPQGE